jgi:uncharacterized phage protein (TIGR01671 family)
MSREIKFEYGFESVNGIIKKVYHLHQLPYINGICDIWGELVCLYVRQFTGLKDKNGVDIYEGDIVSTRTLSAELNDLGFENYEVGFFNGTFCLIKNEQAIRQWKDGTNDWYSLENTESFEIEVIGNIHENKN